MANALVGNPKHAKAKDEKVINILIDMGCTEAHMLVSADFQLQELIDQYTWIPSPGQIDLLAEMRWLFVITAFPDVIALGDYSLARIKMRAANRFKTNQFVINATVRADDYLSAKRTLFNKTQQMLDLLSVVSTRGFKITKINPNIVVDKVKKPFQEKLLSYIIQKLENTKPEEAPISTSKMDQAGHAAPILQTSKEYVAEFKAEGYLTEYATFTHDASPQRFAKVHHSMIKREDFLQRLSEANANYHSIVALRNLTSALRLYRLTLQLNDYATRFILLWTTLESAMGLPRKCQGLQKLTVFADRVNVVPGVGTSERAVAILRSLNKTRNKIVHRIELTARRSFQEALPVSLVKLDWITLNFLLHGLNLKMLHENVSPLYKYEEYEGD